MKSRILIVEDNQPNRELLSDWLEAEGFEVLSAENLEQSFAALQNREIDAVLLDVQLGSDDGLAVATWMRNHAVLRNVPIIAVTAHAMLTDHERVLNAGCNGCVSKPIDFRALREQLDRWIGHPAYSPPAA
ncbi:MAG TPA: response regulator [Candidatus Acidoferrales bacterium]|nr:response regulator [Candidatus Acidoferrales bacterium]